MVDCGPVGRVTADDRSVVEVDAAVTDDDLDWLNRHAPDGIRYERARPQVNTSWITLTTIRG